MISPKEFLDKWNKDIYPLVEYDANILDLLKLNEDAKEFLIKAGLPDSAAPFLNFVSSAKGGAVRFNEKDKVGEEFSKYIYLGFTGNGDPICVIEETGRMVYLDHEDNYSERHINSSIHQFAESILEYAEFVKKIKQVNGRKAFLDRKAPSDLLEWISLKLQDIDSKSLNEKCFWKEELDYYKN